MRTKILLVDDDPEIVELLRFNLVRAGYAVGTASNGIDALKKARSILPDLILLDLMLPELDGFAVCEILRRDPATRSVRIIMVTALATELGRLAGFDCGADDYISKPFSLTDLISRVQAVLSGDGAPEVMVP
jgi:DNA-binding response OmpR family regulator